MQEKIITRKDLYKLVWSETISQLCKKYLISENGFRQIH